MYPRDDQNEKGSPTNPTSQQGWRVLWWWDPVARPHGLKEVVGTNLVLGRSLHYLPSTALSEEEP